MSNGSIGGSTAPMPPPARPPAALRRLVLAYAPAPEAIGTARLLGVVDRGPLVIGRTGGWALPDPQASREHARITLDGDRVWLEDLGSRNGTFVGGARVERAELAPGSVIRIGSHLLVHDVVPPAAVATATEASARSSTIAGEHPAIRALLARASRIAPLAEPVLILGESGTGKELFAEHLHAQSGRRGSFVAVNTASLTEALAESELFGHARGAYTGAAGARTGLFEAAGGGTLFLDEIGDALPTIQAMLLRALATGEIRPVGESRAKRVDARVIAATNVDLEAAIAAGTFRGDLLSRLSAHVLRLPSLRERRSDVLGLALRFLAPPERTAIPAALTADAAEALLLAEYPGNVRELQQIVRHARSESGAVLPIDLAHLPPAIAAPVLARAESSETPSAALELLAIRRDVAPDATELRKVVAACGGNVSRIAAFFGKDRKQIYRWAERLGVPLDPE